MFHGFGTVAFALAASISWGAGDFSGGLATRRAQVLSVVVGAYTVGFIMVVALALLWSEPFPTTLDVIWGTVAGLTGAVGLVAFYQALAVGRMGIVAPFAGAYFWPWRSEGTSKGIRSGITCGNGFWKFFYSYQPSES